MSWSLKTKSVLASIWLFAPTSVVLGIVSPYAVKLHLSSINSAGRSIGSFYSISTLGSLAGTFGAGFFLIPFFGTLKIVAILGVVLIILAIWLSFSTNFNKKICFYWFIFILAISSLSYWFTMPPANTIDQDTAYSRIWIYNSLWGKMREPVRIMRLDSNYSSIMFLNKDDLFLDYTKYYNLAGYFNPTLKKALMIGGAAYSYPKNFIKNYPHAELTVIEIDPAVTNLAKKYFKLPDDPHLIIEHADGRIFLNNTKNKYDVIFIDAFSSSFSIPFQLTTKEAVQKELQTLNDNGVIIVNIISSITGPKGRLARSMYATYKKTFPQVYLFPTKNNEQSDSVQNIMLVALKTKTKPNFAPTGAAWDDQIKHLWKNSIDDEPVLTDNWAPVDYFLSQAL